ncbi:MAG TPA: sigma-70 family RNA polymerase sigma factor [Anaerolineales bacterium]|nr:sigma-70 family RNA polymerase sigma factor [Anaerolineales bacterium]
MAMLFKRDKAKTEIIDWDVVFEEYFPRVFNFFRYRVGDDALAEDLTSTAFEKAWRSRGQFRQDAGSIGTWLFAIARNTANDHFRRNRLEVGLEALEEVPDSFSVEEHFQRADEARRLEILLSQLNPRTRELIALKYGAEMNNREIAQVTSLSETNVGTILNRAVKVLRDAWEMHHE